MLAELLKQTVSLFFAMLQEQIKLNFNTLHLGHSQITAPFKGAIKKLNHDKEAMFIQDIDLNILRDAQKAYGLRK